VAVAAAAASASRRAPLWAVFSRPYLWTSITILSGTVIGSMDSYIVNTSMPRVLGDLGEPQFYAWVASAFILAQVVGLSVAGAWKDRAGLRKPFPIAVAAFGVGSLLCALARRCACWCSRVRFRAWLAVASMRSALPPRRRTQKASACACCR
jgi:MFS family permease